MRILIISIGSLGDVLPLMALGAQLQARGHEVRFYGNAYFRHHADDLALHFTATSPACEYQAFLDSPVATDPKQGMAAVAKGVLKWVASSYQIMRANVLPGETIVIGSTFALVPRLLQERDQVPAAVVHLSPSVLRSEFCAPRFSPLGHMQRWPRFVKRYLWRTLDRVFMDPLYTVPFNAIRAELGLAPVNRMFHSWLHDADLTLCMVPDWFSPRQPDWPARVGMTGFPLCDHGKFAALAPALAQFLDAGAAPVVFTAGTANAISDAFFSVSVRACQLAGLRAVLVTAHRKQLPAELPDGVIHVAYAPFETLLPRAAAFVHHGGIGSLSQAMRAGVRQLIQPMAFDQFDNASRAVQLGVARELLLRHYQPERVAKELKALLGDALVEAQCKRYAAMLTASRGIDQTCDMLLQKLTPGSAEHAQSLPANVV